MENFSFDQLHYFRRSVIRFPVTIMRNFEALSLCGQFAYCNVYSSISLDDSVCANLITSNYGKVCKMIFFTTNSQGLRARVNKDFYYRAKAYVAPEAAKAQIQRKGSGVI